MPDLSGEGKRGRSLRAALDEALTAAPEPQLTATAASPVCSECGGRGWVIRPDGGVGSARRCGCRTEDFVPRLQREAGIPERYRACRLDNFRNHHVTGRERTELTAALSQTRRWIDSFLSPRGFAESGLIFIGPSGVGKTHLAAATLSELIDRYRVRARFVDFTSLVYQIQSTFNDDVNETKRSLLDPVLSTEVLVIDELGAQKATAWVNEVLYLILNGRYTRRRPTLFTTNYYLESDMRPPASVTSRRAAAAAGDAGDTEESRANREPDLLKMRIQSLLVSRIWEMARPIVINSIDYRQHVQAQRLVNPEDD
jgi:DNA replication protein DnaC